MEAFVAAYVSCNCRQCMQDWNLMLTERLSALENEMRSMRELQTQATSLEKREPSQQSQKPAKQEDIKPQMSTKYLSINCYLRDCAFKDSLSY